MTPQKVKIHFQNRQKTNSRQHARTHGTHTHRRRPALRELGARARGMKQMTAAELHNGRRRQHIGPADVAQIFAALSAHDACCCCCCACVVVVVVVAIGSARRSSWSTIAVQTAQACSLVAHAAAVVSARQLLETDAARCRRAPLVAAHVGNLNKSKKKNKKRKDTRRRNFFLKKKII